MECVARRINTADHTHAHLQHFREESVAGLQDTGNTSAAQPGHAEGPDGTAEAAEVETAVSAAPSDAGGTARAQGLHRWGLAGRSGRVHLYTSVWSQVQFAGLANGRWRVRLQTEGGCTPMVRFGRTELVAAPSARLEHAEAQTAECTSFLLGRTRPCRERVNSVRDMLARGKSVRDSARSSERCALEEHSSLGW